MPGDVITMLSGLVTGELTLTKRGANDRRFAITKGNVPMDAEVLAALVSTPVEGESELIASLKSAGLTDQEKIDAAVAQLRITKGMKDLVSPEAQAAVTKAAGYPGAKASDKKTDKAKDKGEGEGDHPPKKPNPFAKSALDLSALDDASRAQVEAVMKSHESMADRTAELERVVKSATDTIAELKDAATTKEFVLKAAKDFSHLPLDEGSLGLMLKTADGVGGKFADSFTTLLGRMNEMVEKSDLLTTMGNIANQSADSAWGKIQAMAKSMVQKSAESGEQLSNAQAIDIVLKTDEGKDLYRKYLGDNPRQRGDVY
jgi:hypothetical protein